MEHIIKYYPVGNADCSLIKLDNGKTVIIDSQIKNVEYDKDGHPLSFDVKKDLLHELKKDAWGHPFVDLFISTHPHEDHCVGFGEHFFCGDPQDYDNDNNENKIIIGELWITPRALGNNLCDSAKDIRKEAKRRRKLYDDDSTFTGNYGNYLHIVGYDNDKNFDSRYGYVPGKIVTSANGVRLEWLEIFIHAPFKNDVEESKETDDKNCTSIVTQFGFKVIGDDEFKCRAIFGGDAEHNVWKHVIENNSDDEKLRWNIFMAPHHCSWSFFNEPEDKKNVLPEAETMLSKQLGENAHIVSSSNKIVDDDNNPPCFKAKEEYLKRLKNTDNFLNTDVHDVFDGIPHPIVFSISSFGKTLRNNIDRAENSILSRPAPRAGLKSKYD